MSCYIYIVPTCTTRSPTLTSIVTAANCCRAMARAVKCVRTRSEPVILTLLFVIMTANAVGGKSTMKTEDVVHVERREGHDVHTVVKAVNQGRSSQFAFCRQAGNCIGRILICPSYCFTTSASREASPSSASLAQKDDYSDYNTDYNDYNYYYYYDYDYGGSPGGGRGGRGGSGGGFGGGNGGRGGFGGGPGSPGSPGGSGRGNVGRGGFGGSPGSPGAGPGGGQGGQGGGTRLGPGGRGPVGRGRGGSNGAVGSGNGCRYDCITSCRAFCAV